MKNLLKMSDLQKADIIKILNLADQLKYEKKHGIYHNYLEGKTLGMIFQKASTRTRVSFETGVYQLGGTALFLSNNDLQIGRGEPIEDTARTLSRYLDGIMIRTFDQSEVEKLAENSTVPVINGLTDYSHPCQVLADLMTVREYKNQLEGLKLCFIGDGNNMMNSLIVGCLTCGMTVSVAYPKGYEPSEDVMKFASESDRFFAYRDPKDAVKDADVVYTDVWTSMGQESERQERIAAFSGKYQVNDELLSLAKPDCMVMHCLPAHKGEEITEKLFEEHADEIFDQAENRLHAQKAIMVLTMSDNYETEK